MADINDSKTERLLDADFNSKISDSDECCEWAFEHLVKGSRNPVSVALKSSLE